MTRCDALVIGGGPAGSSCARLLRRRGWDVRVIDRAVFPRDKTCAGWVTPGVFTQLELDPAEYAATGLTLQPISGFQTSVLGDATPIETRYRSVVSYAIRRCEFDAYLLRRADVPVIHDTVSSLTRQGDTWLVNGQYQAPVLVGAGGHFCPVASHLRGGHDRVQAVVAREAEYQPPRGGTVEGPVVELFYCADLEGYGWCVRKGDFLNVGLGRRRAQGLNDHVHAFAEFLERTGKAPGATRATWRGHAYLNDGAGSRPVAGDGVLLVGDAAGLAYAESGEGIRPAVDSGCLAAEILAERTSLADATTRYAAALAQRYPPAWHTPAALAGPATWLGRRLLRSRTFTRRVVLDRWFLRHA